MMRVNSPMPELHAGMEKAGCIDEPGASNGRAMKCPDGSSFITRDQGAIMCKGKASGESACRAAIVRFGGVPGGNL